MGKHEKAVKKAAKAERRKLKKEKAKKRNRKTRKLGLLLMGAYVPAFVNIHFRYARHNFKIWAALFIAPFLVVKLAIIRLVDMLPDDNHVVWHYDLLAIFTISICFYLAERFDNFRRIYVWAVPVTIFFGLLYWSNGEGSNQLSGAVVKLMLIAYLTYRVGKFTLTDGYVQLDDGADADYHAGKELYDIGDYEQGLPLLETSASRGHFKSLVLLGDAYAHGHHYNQDLIKAAACYHKASQKGYATATKRYGAISDILTGEQIIEAENLVRDKSFLTE